MKQSKSHNFIRSTELAERIKEATRQIQEAEKELIELRITDIDRPEEDNNGCLWSYLGLLQTPALTHQIYLTPHEGDLCFSALALLEKLLGHIPQSVLQMQGCHIQTQDENVWIQISLSTSVEALERAIESYRPHVLRK